jgi:hypothetical protein
VERLTRLIVFISLSAGISALPAMRKLMTVMTNKIADWNKLEEMPVCRVCVPLSADSVCGHSRCSTLLQVEIPIPKELRFHSVFSCPVSKEESTPTNPPMLLKCGHVICRSCVKRISYNMTRCVNSMR